MSTPYSLLKQCRYPTESFYKSAIGRHPVRVRVHPYTYQNPLLLPLGKSWISVGSIIVVLGRPVRLIMYMSRWHHACPSR